MFIIMLKVCLALKKIVIIPLIFAVVISLTAVGVSYAQETENDTIPSWVKSIFLYYAHESINDEELIEALGFLIDSNIILIDNQKVQEISLSETEKKLYELEILTKDNTIMTLENDLKIMA